jgi:hypothetical protein
MDTPASSAPPGDGSTTPALPREKPAIPASSAAPGDEWATIDIRAIQGPVPECWREQILTRAKELEALSLWMGPCDEQDNSGVLENGEVLRKAIGVHLKAARQAARGDRLNPPRPFRLPLRRYGARIERARSNLDAAEAHLLTLAPSDYILGQCRACSTMFSVISLPLTRDDRSLSGSPKGLVSRIRIIRRTMSAKTPATPTRKLSSMASAARSQTSCERQARRRYASTYVWAASNTS